MPELSEKKHIVTALVTNESGVLTRISGLFARRCFNIDSLIACATEHPEYSRITITVRGDETVLRQIIAQLGKLVDCHCAVELKAEQAVMRELLLIKLKADATDRAGIEEVCRAHGAKIADTAERSIVLELAGKPTELDSFIAALDGYEITELSRTGMTALECGDGKLNSERNRTETV